MEKRSKGQTFLGFAMRTGKFRIGQNAVMTLKRINLLIVCKSISENSLKKAKKTAKDYKCKLLMTNLNTLDELTHKENAKVMAIYESKLSKEILMNLGEDFIELDLEN